jgi:hypothetical protein
MVESDFAIKVDRLRETAANSSHVAFGWKIGKGGGLRRRR